MNNFSSILHPRSSIVEERFQTLDCLYVLSPGCDVPSHDGDVGSMGTSSGALSPNDPLRMWGQLWGLCGSTAHRLHLPNLGLARCFLPLW